MSKRRISKEQIQSIAEERVLKLTSLSIDALKNQKIDRAKRYVFLALRICQKTQIHMPKGFSFCKKCHIPLIPGVNQKIRLNNTRIISTCEECGEIKRRPYRMEKKT